MSTAFFRFYAELNDYLPAGSRQIESSYFFEDRITVKEMIESLGVPHSEVDLILVEGQPVDFTYIVHENDRISVYPVFEALNIAPLVRLRPNPLRQVRFVLDNQLGKLAGCLRLLGFDALYRNDYFSSSPFGRGQGEGRSYDEILVQISIAERRILLTRDRALLRRKEITHGYCVQATDPDEQLIEVVERFDLSDALKPLKR